MTQEIRERMAEYAKRKEGSRRKEESAIEAIRWHVTSTIIKHHPDADFQWVTLEGSIFLEAQVRLGDYVWQYKFSRDVMDAPGFAINVAISNLLERMEFDPLRQMFKT